jgi:uncharacterized protein
MDDSLRAVMADMHRLLRGEIDARAAAERLGAPVERLEVYAGFVRRHVRSVVTKDYPILSEVLAPEVWARLLDRFFAEHPSRHYELNANAGPFRELLSQEASLPDGEVGEAHVELAELEWQELVAYFSTEEIPDASAVSIPTLNPTLRVLQLAWPMASFVDAWREADTPSQRPTLPDAPAPETALVLRHPRTHLALLHRADDGLLFALKIAHDRIPQTEAAAAVGIPEPDARALLERADRLGLIVLPSARRR